jgi:hypothetical protein
VSVGTGVGVEVGRGTDVGVGVGDGAGVAVGVGVASAAGGLVSFRVDGAGALQADSAARTTGRARFMGEGTRGRRFGSDPAAA